MNLTDDAMQVSLRITAWSGRLYDRQASNHVAVHHDAAASAGRYNKRLLPKAAFAALTATVSACRTAHYENTVPWDDQGLAPAHRRQLRALHRADGRLPRAHGARARPLHRGLRRQRRPVPPRPRQALPHRGLPHQGSAPGQVLDPLPHHRGPGRRAVHGEARDGAERPRQHPRLAEPPAPLHDGRGAPGLQLEFPEPALHRRRPLPSFHPLGGHGRDRRHHRHLRLAAGPDPRGLLGRAPRDRDGDPA